MKQVINKEKLKAITLIESLVYLAVFAVIFLVIMQYFLSISAQNEFAQSSINSEKDVQFISDHLFTSFDQAYGIDTVNSEFEVSQSTLILGMDELMATNSRYEINDNRLLFTDESGQSSYISHSRNIIEEFLVQEVTNSVGETVGVRVTISFASENIEYERTFTTSYIIESAS